MIQLIIKIQLKRVINNSKKNIKILKIKRRKNKIIILKNLNK